MSTIRVQASVLKQPLKGLGCSVCSILSEVAPPPPPPSHSWNHQMWQEISAAGADSHLWDPTLGTASGGKSGFGSRARDWPGTDGRTRAEAYDWEAEEEEDLRKSNASSGLVSFSRRISAVLCRCVRHWNMIYCTRTCTHARTRTSLRACRIIPYPEMITRRPLDSLFATFSS